MICPKCNANNPKDPMQCIRCGYIFPEYIAKHNIDMTRGNSEAKETQKRIEAVKNFTPKQNGLNPKSARYQQVAQREIVNEPEKPIQAPIKEPKLKMERIIGRNGINRTKDVKECFTVFMVNVVIIIAIYFYLTNK